MIVAPFALPGERIRVRVYRSSRLHSFADLVEVVTPNPDLRDDSRAKCRYFGKCSGCQYQVRYFLCVSDWDIGRPNRWQRRVITSVYLRSTADCRDIDALLR